MSTVVDPLERLIADAYYRLIEETIPSLEKILAVKKKVEVSCDDVE